MFAIVTIALAVILTLGVVLAGDLYLNRKYMDLVALNPWGYRGPAVGSKQPGEQRIAFIGGSTAFGYGVHWRDAVPALLQERLNDAGDTARHVRVLNLAGNGEGAHSFRSTLQDYDYLDYDAIIIYSGYNDLSANTQVFRHESIAFRLTGYLPIFPMIFQEKAMVIRWNGRLGDAYRGVKTTFVPSITQRVTATALETAVKISESLDRQFKSGEKIIEEGDWGHRLVVDGGSSEGVGCEELFKHFCGEMYLAISFAIDRGKTVLMVTQPYISATHREQQDLLHGFLERRFRGDPRLRFASMGDEIDLNDPTLSYDGMHLTPAGNRRIAVALETFARRQIQ